jgi:hypothetical protein
MCVCKAGTHHAHELRAAVVTVTCDRVQRRCRPAVTGLPDLAALSCELESGAPEWLNGSNELNVNHDEQTPLGQERAKLSQFAPVYPPWHAQSMPPYMYGSTQSFAGWCSR